MGRWLSKTDYRERAKRIVKLKEVDKLTLSQIARRLGVHQGIVEYSYYKFKGKDE